MYNFSSFFHFKNIIFLGESIQFIWAKNPFQTLFGERFFPVKRKNPAFEDGTLKIEFFLCIKTFFKLTVQISQNNLIYSTPYTKSIVLTKYILSIYSASSTTGICNRWINSQIFLNHWNSVLKFSLEEVSFESYFIVQNEHASFLREFAGCRIFDNSRHLQCWLVGLRFTLYNLIEYFKEFSLGEDY